MSDAYYEGREDKNTSFGNWLKDEKLDRMAGIEPTHPGHSVDDPSRWSGQGKGDVSRVVSDRFLDNYDKIFGDSPPKDENLIRTKYRDGVKTFVVSTPEGIVEMSEEEYNSFLTNNQQGP